MLELGETWSKVKLKIVVAVAGFHTVTRKADVAEEHGLHLDWQIHFTEPQGGTSSSVADAGQNIVGKRSRGKIKDPNISWKKF